MYNEENLTPTEQELESVLGQLKPMANTLKRDALMFNAGRATAGKKRPWQMLSGVLIVLLLCSVLARPDLNGVRILSSSPEPGEFQMMQTLYQPAQAEPPGSLACATNLSGIGMALLMYSNEHNDKFPPDLETLIIKTYFPAKMLMCPATKLKDSYIYRGASITISDTPWMITVYEKPSNHGGGRNVLFLDSHVDWVPEERFQELIKKDNEYRREKGLPVLPAQ